MIRRSAKMTKAEVIHEQPANGSFQAPLTCLTWADDVIACHKGWCAKDVCPPHVHDVRPEELPVFNYL